MEVSGAVVLITGASSGIGAAAARAFDRAGASVAVAARRRDELEALAATLRSALVVPTDLARRGAARAMVEATIARFGRIDVLINNAASLSVERSDGIGAADLRTALQTNFLAAVEAVNAALPAMRKQGRGLIVNVSSPGAFVAMPLMAAYAGSKGALSAWTRTAQAEWAGSGIEVVEFLPGRVDTGSRPVSSLGEIGPEVFEEAARGWLSGLLLNPQRPDDVGERLVDCVRRPRPVVYSSPAARLAALVGASPRMSRRLAARLAQVARGRLAVSLFSPLAEAPSASRQPGRDAQVAAPLAAASPVVPQAAVAPPPVVSPPTVASPPPPVSKAVETPPALEATSASADKGSVPAGKKESAAVHGANGAAKAAGKAPRKRAAKKPAAKKSATAKNGAAPAKGARPAAKTRRGDDDAAHAVSPIMSERVRAAAEKAAAAARGAATTKRRNSNGDADGGEG